MEVGELPENNKYADFDKIEIITELEGILKNDAPLHVGTAAARAQMGMDKPIERGLLPHAKDMKEEPYIPGSSLKGVLRSLAERLVRSGFLGQDSWACDPFNAQDKEREDEEGPCIICGIFGGGGLKKNKVASHVEISNAYPEDPASVSVRIRTRVAISRLKGGAAGGRLFNMEMVEPGVRWKFNMRIINIDLRDENEPRAKLLREVLRLLRDGKLSVGGGRSVGLGSIRLEEARLTFYTIKNGGLAKEGPIPIDDVLGGGE